MKNEKGRTTTKDFYLACVMRAYGLPMIGLERGEGQFSLFVFDDPEFEAESIVRQYWDHQVMVDAKLLIDTVYELKTRLHSGEGRV